MMSSRARKSSSESESSTAGCRTSFRAPCIDLRRSTTSRANCRMTLLCPSGRPRPLSQSTNRATGHPLCQCVAQSFQWDITTADDATDSLPLQLCAHLECRRRGSRTRAFRYDPGRFHECQHRGAHLVIADEHETVDAVPHDPGWILERDPGSQPFRERVDGRVLVQRAIPPG